MAKRLYSLMLNDEVVRAVDEEAHRRGTNRSALIDNVLAEYFGVSTFQRRMNDIFSEIDSFFASSENLVPFFMPHSDTFYLKSALSYKYRPTLKYELVLDHSTSNKLGDMTLHFRTQSEALLEELARFFKLWVGIERSYFEENGLQVPAYSLYQNRFMRSIALPQKRDYNAQQIAAAVSRYVDFFDASLKAYIGGAKDREAIARDYAEYVQEAGIIL